MNLWVVLIFFIFGFINDAISGEFETKGQIVGWADGSYNDNSLDKNLGIRAIPEFSYRMALFNDNSLELFTSFNAYLSTNLDTAFYDLKLYRLKLRYATEQMDIRIGLQKIEFGPAKILRPLRWFDSVDPRDPLKMTDGVYAGLFRYYFFNNFNIWLWGVYGQDKTRGMDLLPSEEGSIEYGGRLQFPLFTGESGVSYHHRKVNVGFINHQYNEQRFALDGYWDIGIGAWYEAVAKYGDSDLLPYQWQKLLTIGADYTIAIGNGVYTAAEHLITQVSREFSGRELEYNTTSLTIMYPFGIFDNISSITYYKWDDAQFYQFISWMRTYDRFAFNLNLFYYPQGSAKLDDTNLHIPKSGYGAQIMVMYNY